ncbi:MAG TPA: hypothetical protein PK926_11420 [Spirochaetota bacterium]|nr:hypothetical protein [Spirochaetota bacterium]HPI89109.1 hypothetical protein [Spirochaetota bacterium]HPR48863.1 hypothetical protein [Spirochaetota bacterium]
MKKLLVIAIVFAIAQIVAFSGHSGTDAHGAETLYINQDFYTAFSKIPAVKRDDFFESKLDCVILTRAKVLKIDSSGRYKKKYRIILEDGESINAGFRFMYYVYIDNQDSIDLLAENEILEFSGQVMGFTPLTTDRKSYLFDILMEKGAILVQ